jgi:hypothetical protein
MHIRPCARLGTCTCVQSPISLRVARVRPVCVANGQLVWPSLLTPRLAASCVANPAPGNTPYRAEFARWVGCVRVTDVSHRVMYCLGCAVGFVW